MVRRMRRPALGELAVTPPTTIRTRTAEASVALLSSPRARPRILVGLSQCALAVEADRLLHGNEPIPLRASVAGTRAVRVRPVRVVVLEGRCGRRRLSVWLVCKCACSLELRIRV